MKRGLAFLIVVVSCGAQTPPMTVGQYSVPVTRDSIREWRIATDAERNARIHDQMAWMVKNGWEGDPACTMGDAFGYGDIRYSSDPCRLTNAKGEFTALVDIRVAGKHCVVTGEQEELYIRSKGKDKSGFYDGGAAIDGCREGKLPKLVLR